MTDSTCQHPGCQDARKIRSWCARHYGLLYRTGALETLPRRPVSDVNDAQMTCTCAIHGPGSRLRVRVRATGPYYTCRTCDRGSRGRGSGKPETAHQRRWRKYGLSESEFELMLTGQQGKCLICQDEMDRPCVDHNHTTGAVRGLLCPDCNLALGLLRDNAESLKRATRYLKLYA